MAGMALGSLPIHTTAPNIGEITSKWLTADSVTKAGAAAKDMANTTYMSGTYTPASETVGLIGVVNKDIEKAYKQRATDLDRMGLAQSDSWMTSGERLEMMRRLDEEKTTEQTKSEQELLYNDQQTWAQQKYNYVMDTIKVDDATKQDLLYGDLADVLTKYQVQEADLMNLRTLASQAGMYAFAKGINLFGK
jgi:hypothetical protein